MAEEKQILSYSEIVKGLSGIAHDGKTGTFSIATSDNHFATISMKKGQVLGATYRQLKGQAAIDKITQISGGRFSFSEDTLRSNEADETISSSDEVFKALGIDKIEEQVTKIESADFIGETILEVIEKEAVAYLGPIAATICKEKFAEAGEIKNQTELLQLLEGIADLMGDNNKGAEFKNRVIEKLK